MNSTAGKVLVTNVRLILHQRSRLRLTCIEAKRHELYSIEAVLQNFLIDGAQVDHCDSRSFPSFCPSAILIPLECQRPRLALPLRGVLAVQQCCHLIQDSRDIVCGCDSGVVLFGAS